MRAPANELHLMLIAVQYFTRLPVPRWVEYSDRRLNDAVRYLPLVGILAGLVTGAAFALAGHLFPHSLAVLLAMLAGVVLTGGFHEDGLADACDGFGGGWNRQQVLEIMKDSRIGTYGVLGLCFALALKFAALVAVPPVQFAAVAVAAHGYSRFMAVTVIAAQTYVREDATARARHAAQNVTRANLACAGCFALAPIIYLGAPGVVGAAGASVLRVLAGQYFFRRIGGYTGDCLGAVQQVTEIGFYLGVIAWMST